MKDAATTNSGQTNIVGFKEQLKKPEVPKYFFVNTEQKLEELCESLADAKAVSLDGEWWSEYNPHKVLIFQILIFNYKDFQIFILDLMTLPLDRVFEILKKLFEDKDVIKLGCDFINDLFNLNITFNSFTGGKPLKVESYIDVFHLFNMCMDGETGERRHCIGLSKMCALALAVDLSKDEQLSNWSHRPLTDTQLTYAALDVLYAFRLYEKFRDYYVEKNPRTKPNVHECIRNSYSKCLETKTRKGSIKNKQPGERASLKMQNEDTIGKLDCNVEELFENCTMNWQNWIPKFSCDKLEKNFICHLRGIGLDTIGIDCTNTTPRQIIERAHSYGRVFLTKLAKFGCCTFQVEHKDELHNLRKVVEKFNIELSKKNLFTRCVHCNGLIEHDENVTFDACDFMRNTDKFLHVIEKHKETFKAFQCKRCDAYSWSCQTDGGMADSTGKKGKYCKMFRL